MRLRTRIAVAAAVLIASVGMVSWLVPGSGTALAFVDMVEALSNVQTAKWKTTTVVKLPQGKAETAHEIGMFLAPHHERIERTQDGHESIAIFDGRKNVATLLDPTTKQATLMNFKMKMEGIPPDEGPFGKRFLGLRQTVMSAQSGELKKAEPLGVEVVDGRRAVGFRMQHGRNETKIWADPKTSLPIRVEYATSGETEIHIVMTDFEVDLDLDESLFSLDVPEGYSTDKLQLELPKTPLVFLAKMLGIAAELNDGVFPPALRGEQGMDGTVPRLMRTYLEKKYGDPAAYWKKKFGGTPAEIEERGFDKSDVEKATAELRKETAEFSMSAAGATALLNGLSPKMDWHYAGKDVKLNTPNRPIFWMKAWMRGPKKGGKYEVIYADLSVKEVGPEDVPKVPDSETSPKQ